MSTFCFVQITMEEIAQLKVKHMKINASVFENLLLSQTEIIDEIKRKQDKRLNEVELKIQQLTSKLDGLKETLHTETQILEQKDNELSKHNDCLKGLETEKKKLLQEIKQLEAKRNNLKSAKPSLQDQFVLEQGKKKYKLYENLTKIHWDYEATKNNTIKGYVSNKHDYIHHFSYKVEEINDKLNDSLWHEIYLSTSEVEVGNENIRPKNI